VDLLARSHYVICLAVATAETEKLIDARAALPNVIATPHIAGLTPQAVESQAFDTVRQMQAILRGEVPEGAVNAERWTRAPRR
jgi:phosphoglycerate dehydrogenase-like enzyme